MASASGSEPLRVTPLHGEHVALGARVVPFAGYQMPLQYEGITAEHHAVRRAAGLFDVSHMGELVFAGPGALAAVNRFVTNDLERCAVGQAMYTCCCNEAGTILDDLIVYRLAAERVMVVCNASNRAKIAGHLLATPPEGAEAADVSDETALLALQGPHALATLAAAHTSLDVARELGRFRVAEARIDGIPVTIARTGYTGEDGVELFCANSDAVSLWRTLLAAGQYLGLVPVGLGARDTLRLEACLSLYGHEIDETTDPFEAGLGFTVKLDQPDFVGKAALLRRRAEGTGRRLVGFEMVGRGVARHGYPLLDETGETIGRCTSGGPCPTLGKHLGLGYVPERRAELGQPLLVDCRGKSVAAVVVPTPFYRRTTG